MRGSHLFVPLFVAALAAVAACGGPPARARSSGTVTSSTTRVTEPFRKEHVELARHLQHVHEWNGELQAQPPAEQARTMKKIVGFFEGHLAPHAKWEEEHLYVSVDKRAASGPNPFTASMRFEHRVVERWIAELRREAEAPSPNVSAFARRTDYLLGLVTAHFEAEEEVLLPVLDRTMTAEEFERELGRHEGGGHH
jgi:hemerythrin-like domain-containing protein